MVEQQLLDEIRNQTGVAETTGLDDSVIASFLAKDSTLSEVIKHGHQRFMQWQRCPELAKWLKGDEAKCIQYLQKGILNFYNPNSVNPFIPLYGQGPWIITSHGAIVHDSGGYGMLGFGHEPAPVVNAMATPQVMANVMTANLAHRVMIEALNREIGQCRQSQQDVYDYLFLNSGSEAMSMALRLADLNTQQQWMDKEVGACKFLVLEGSFHGRTDLPARLSQSSQQVYRSLLYSFRHNDNVLTVPPNDTDALEGVFANAVERGWFIQAVIFEPVMGEGVPGLAINTDFYAVARALTQAHHGLLIIDAVQAGLRTSGYLSVVDQPGFESLPPPDIEVFSKAINAGQYPLSVVSVNKQLSHIFRTGIYGNTMSANPRALLVGTAVLSMLTDQVRQNIRQRGEQALQKFKVLQQKYPGIIEGVRGTGLLFALDIFPRVAQVQGKDGLEAKLRQVGIGVVHGGSNALRFTPHFKLTSDELDLMVDVVDGVLAAIPIA